MSLPIAILLVLGGFVLLAFGGEVLVRGAIAISRQLNVSPAVIGLTIVAMATSLPELAVSLSASLRGSDDMVVGNVIGSNIFNMAAILGITAIAFPPLRFRERMIRFDITVMVLAAIAAWVVSRDLVVGRGEGIVFLLLLGAFLIYRTRKAKQPGITPGEGNASEIADELNMHQTRFKGIAGPVLLILLGAGLLTGGAELLVRGAVVVARVAGLSERVIAVTIISAGTGLPELAAAIMAGIRKHAAVAVGNVIGSNIFNIFGILGTVSLVRPINVSPLLAGRDMGWMLAFSLIAVIPVLHRGRRISRVEGIIALACYVVYIATLL